ncbi:conserved exported hypothetical protein [Crenothrix polyspora]|uniref:Uncharacterized protein n=1 Tax=Crenothrix polyspora TaxID=360316 RepID=A0A1R4HI23_9GAMM|nr:hypothetical protein [Crenothrix polyspora]SJM95886.1 conserved exported hypothetical protein [Crenothrix polyspora]
MTQNCQSKRLFYSLAHAALSLTLLNCTQAAAVTSTPIEDPRSYQHGIDFVSLPDSNYYLVWASSGNPPTRAKPDDSWPHDIYYSKINPQNPKITPQLLISNPEAQEPASAAISSDGNIMVTTEDGWNTTNEVAQRYGIYDLNLNPVLPYPRMAYDGGHSGHVAAVDNHFVLFYSDDWVNGGGVDNLGSGDDVIAMIYSAKGELEGKIDIATGNTTRDWWPLVAGSKTRAALVWQRYVDKQIYGQLMLSILDVKQKTLVVNALKIEDSVKYYTYSVTYLPSIERFLILGAYQDGAGFAYLLDQDGHIMAANKTLPAIVRESQSIALEQSGMVKIAQPITPNGLAILAITPSSITLKSTVADDYQWQYSGIDGIFLNPNTVYIVSTSASGLVEKTFHLSDKD